MDDRLKSGILVALIHAVLGYALFVGLSFPIPQRVIDTMSLINLLPEKPPPPQKLKPTPPKASPKSSSVPPVAEPPPVHASSRAAAQSDAVQDWLTMTPWQKILSVVRTQKFVVEYVAAETKRLNDWRATVPQGSGGARVTRVRPPNLATHTVYWPAEPRGLLPIIAWGNESEGMCSNNSLPYAGFLGEIASHGYFIVAIGNDDLEFPRTGGPVAAADGRPLKSQALALKKGVDWAIAENSRAGSPWQGKLDTGKIAYMGHGCGGGQAMEMAMSDPRTTTVVLLNSTARFRPRPPPINPESGFTLDTPFYKAPIAFFEGWQDDGDVISAGDANFNRARDAEWPYFIAALNGMGHDEAYPGPEPRWCKAVIAWLDWQLKGDTGSLPILQGLWRKGWTNVGSTNL